MAGKRKAELIVSVWAFLLLVAMFSIALDVRVVKGNSGTIYIRADGSIEPSDAPISSFDNVTYTFTDNISDSIVIERDKIVVDGAGYMLQGTDASLSKGIYLDGRSNVTIKNTNIKNFYYGIFIIRSSYNRISGNNITNNYFGAYLEASSQNTISRNNVKSNNQDGILLLYGSSSNTIYGNNITNYWNGIYLYQSSNNTISGNNITSSGADGIVLSYSSNNAISANKITNCRYGNPRQFGIHLAFSNNSTIFGNKITNNTEGIILEVSSSNTISGNNMTNNDYGVELFDSSNNNILLGNNIATNQLRGIVLSLSSNNKVMRNSLTTNGDGIELNLSSHNNTIRENNITNNHWHGIVLVISDNNIIYHNNFINNTKHIILLDSYGNVWDDGYPSGGNYWSDYTDVDLYNGPYQNETGSDGIGDTPYVIDGDNQDNYPLMKPFGPVKTVFNVTWNEETYLVTLVSNSTITDFDFSQPLKQISFNVTGPNGSTGFCNITIPKELLNGDFTVLIDGQPPLTLTLTENETHTSLYFTYTHTTHQVKIVGTAVIGEEEKVLLGTGWGWMRIAHKEYVYGRAELYKIGDEQIELVIDEYSRTWNIIRHKEHKHHEIYFCFSREHGVLIVGLHHARWTFWYAVGKDTIAFGHPRFGRLRLMPI